MTLQKVIEEINQIFPQIGESQIIYDIDLAQKDFIAETNYLEGYTSLTNPSSNCAWYLPSDYNGFKEILIYDVDGNPLYLEDYQIAYEIEFGAIYFYSTTATVITALPDVMEYVFLGYYKKASTVSLIGDSFLVSDDLVPGITAKVLKKYFSTFPTNVLTATGSIISMINIPIANYWKSEETMYRIKAKRWVNAKNDTSDGSTIYQDAGKWVFPKRVSSLISSSSTATPVVTTNVKEVTYIITPSGITQSGDIIGFTSMTATLDLPNNRVTFTGDISAYTDFNSNNKDTFVYDKVDGSYLTIEWDTGITGTIVFTLFEKVAH